MASRAKGPHVKRNAAKVTSRSFERAANTLVKRRWSRKVRSDDPRRGAALRRLRKGAETARDAGEKLLKSPPTPTRQTGKAAEIREFVRDTDALRAVGLTQELGDIINTSVGNEKGQEAVKLRLGLATGSPMTLQRAADEVRLTRERVRQLEKSFRATMGACQPWTPALKKSLRVLRDALPLTEPDAIELLRVNGLIDPSDQLDLAVVCEFAQLAQVRLPFATAEGMLFPSDMVASVAAVGRTARRLTTHWGLTTVEELCEQVSTQANDPIDQETARMALERVPGMEWLDAGGGWFWIKGRAQNRLLNQVERIMSVAGSISLAELRDGVGRHYRMRGFRPPREILSSLCEATGLYERQGDRIVGGGGLPDWRQVLGKNEATIVDILFDRGPVMRRDDLEKLAVEERGLNRSSFYVYLTYSPVLERFAPGVFGLRGAPANAATVKAMIPPRVRSQVLQDHGWTSDGSVWIGYKISSAAAGSGVLGVPSVLDELLEGSFSLFAEDGTRVGTLVVDDNMWGLSPFYRRRGIEAGDHVVLTFDPKKREATIAAGTEDLLLRFQSGE